MYQVRLEGPCHLYEGLHRELLGDVALLVAPREVRAVFEEDVAHHDVPVARCLWLQRYLPHKKVPPP